MDVFKSAAMAGNPGRYISMENGLMVESAPRMRMVMTCCLRFIMNRRKDRISVFISVTVPVNRLEHSLLIGPSKKSYLWWTNMTGCNNHFYKTRVSRTLLTLTLLFSLFAFSGSESRSPAPGSGIARTELVASSRVNEKRIISFTNASANFISHCLSFDLYRSGLVWASRLKSNLMATKIKHLDRLIFSVYPTALFFHSRTIPQSTDEIS